MQNRIEESITNEMTGRLYGQPDRIQALVKSENLRKLVKQLNNGEIKYRLISDTDETAKNKVDLRKFDFTIMDSTYDDDLEFISTTFEYADLMGCKFIGCSFKDVFFENCNLLYSDFRESTFISSTFLNCDIASSSFSECTFESQIINNCDMNKCKFTNFCDFTDGFVIKNTNLSYTEWENCILKNGEISEESVLENSIFNQTNFERVQIDTCDLKGIYFGNNQFNYCIIEGSSMLNADFEGCFIDQSEFINNLMNNVIFRHNTSIQNCDFTESTMEKLRVLDVKIINCDFTDTTSLQESEFDYVTITDSLFPSVNFTLCFFKTKISLIRCNFSGANFENISVIRAERIDVKNSTFENAMFGSGPMRIDNITPVFDNYNPDFTLADYNIMVENDWSTDLDLDEDYDEASEGLTNADKCFWAIGPYDVQNADYLKNTNNFIIRLPGDSGNYECASLSDMKRAANLKGELGLDYRDYKGFYECSKELMDKVRKTGVTPLSFKPGVDFNFEVEYIQFGTASKYYVKKPEWLWDGPIPEPKKFKLVQDSPDLKYFVSKSVAIYRGNVVSDTHCDLQDNGYIYRLEPILEPIRSGGKKVRNLNKKTMKTMKRKGKKTMKRKGKKTMKRKGKKTMKRKGKKTMKRKGKKNKKTMKK